MHFCGRESSHPMVASLLWILNAMQWLLACHEYPLLSRSWACDCHTTPGRWDWLSGSISVWFQSCFCSGTALVALMDALWQKKCNPCNSPGLSSFQYNRPRHLCINSRLGFESCTPAFPFIPDGMANSESGSERLFSLHFGYGASQDSILAPMLLQSPWNCLFHGDLKWHQFANNTQLCFFFHLIQVRQRRY